MLTLKKHSRIIFLLTVCCLLSCKPVIRILYGIRKPKVENERSITHYLDKVRLRKENVYALAFDDYKATLELIKNKVPEVFIFDRQGHMIPYGDEWACNAHVFSFIEELSDTAHYTISGKTTLEKESNKLITLKGEKASVPKDPSTDFYVFIYWVKFAGKLNKDHVREWEQQAAANKHARITVIKVNMDFQESWGKENLGKVQAKK